MTVDSTERHAARPPAACATQTFRGVVVVKQAEFGFIKCLHSGAGDVAGEDVETRQTQSSRIYFSTEGSAGSVNVGQRVSFELQKDPSSGRAMAVNVTKVEDGYGGTHPCGTVSVSRRVLAPEPMDLEIAIEGRYTGVVQALPKAGTTTRVDDGMLSFIDLEGRQQQAMFGRWRIEGANGASGAASFELELGQPVMFTLAQNPVTKELKANAVRVDQDVFEAMKRLGITSGATSNSSAGNNAATRAVTRPAAPTTATTPVTTSTEFGKVVLLKKEFGFIKRVFESGDLFFHFTELDLSDDPTVARDQINVGDELEFSVHADESGRACARNIRRAPPGSALSEVIGEEVFHGVVLEKPTLGKSYDKTPGVIDFVASPLIAGQILSAKQWALAPKIKVLFYPNESEGIQNLRPGSHVAFRILTDLNALKSAKMAGKDGMLVDLISRRAVQVCPIRGEGIIVDLQKTFGFLTWSGNFFEGVQISSPGNLKAKPHRLFFGRHDLDKSQDFNVGDIVYFSLQSTKTSDDMAASRLKKSEKSVRVPTESVPTYGMGGVGGTEPPARRKPLKLKKPSVAQPRIPDGTRGFTLPRGGWLREESANELKIVSMCCGFRIQGVLTGGMSRSLSVEAIPFEAKMY